MKPSNSIINDMYSCIRVYTCTVGIYRCVYVLGHSDVDTQLLNVYAVLLFTRIL